MTIYKMLASIYKRASCVISCKIVASIVVGDLINEH